MMQLGRNQGDHRGAAREPRHRDHQVHRVPVLRLELDARRERALARRHRQPGAAAARRPQVAARRPTTSIRSATAASATSTRSSCRSSCSRSAACSRSTRASRRSSTRTSSRSPWLPIVVLLVAIVLECFSFRTAIRESNHPRGTQSWVAVHPPRQGARAARRAARGRRRAHRPRVRAARRRAHDHHRQPASATRIGTLAIGVLLVLVAIVLGIETKSLLVGEGANPATTSRRSATRSTRTRRSRRSST